MYPTFARVLLERPRVEKIGSIHLPSEAQKRLAFLKCKVFDVGPTCDGSIKPGQEVLIGRHAGDWINSDGVPGVPSDATKEYFIVQDEDILAIVEDVEEPAETLAAAE